jgi:VCBS repeat-containing protein
LVFFALLAAPISTFAAQATLAWDGSTQAGLAGYKVYSGTSSKNYTFSCDAGNSNSYTFTNLESGKTYYFAATSYDAYGNQSVYSQEVSYAVPVPNSAPVANAGSLTVPQDIVGSGTLVASDPDGDAIIYSIVSQGTLGTATVNSSTGAYTYAPKSGVKGTDSFTFQAKDPGGLTSTAIVAVTITAVNHAPVAQAGSLSLPQDTIGSGTLVAGDPDGDALSFSILGQGTLGTASVNPSTGAYTYAPKSDVKGTDSFTFQAKDPGGLTAVATVTVTINGVNRAPVAGSSTLTIIQDTETSGKLVATDADGDALKYQIVASTTKGTVKLDAAKGSFTYTPVTGFVGTDTFTFKVNDGAVDSNVASVKITVTAHAKIQFEAEQALLTYPMVRASDRKSSGGKYIWVANGKGDVYDPMGTGGQAVFTFNVPSSGNYVMWGRVANANINDNSFFISMDFAYPFAWHTAVAAKGTWVWDQIREDYNAAPTVFYLEAGTHTLSIKQREDGSKLDSILLTTQSDLIPKTLYSDETNGAIDGWDVFDADPAGAFITSVYDENRQSEAIELRGDGVNNGYRLRSKDFRSWTNTSQFVIEWSMEYAEKFIIYVEVQTSLGLRTLQYEPINNNPLGTRSTVRLGVGDGTTDGLWHTFVRDLQADLNLAQKNATILSVNSFSIRGSGKVDDIKLRESL